MNWSFQSTPLQTWIWRVFLIWTSVGALVLPFGLQPEQLARWPATADWVGTARTLLAYADLVWMVLAALVVYLQAAADEGLARARVAGGIVAFGSAVVEWVGATTGFPFGPYVYTDAFGPRMLGVLPIAIPLAWMVIVLAARQVLWARWPGLSRAQLALGVGAIALATDFNLEHVAWKVRGYWLWYPGVDSPPSWPPWQNYLSWFLLAALFAALIPRPAGTFASARRPLGVLLAMNALFLLAHLVRWVR
ncbi:MAG: carotenoid biosynthesis protein [Verrucomicrobia bacterium]|nr:carotenoid biosynthesis protein [Verrucomicrobiota bacterium]